MKRFLAAVLAVWALYPGAARADETHFELEGDYQLSVKLNGGDVNRDRFYLIPRAEWTHDSLSFFASVRGWVGTGPDHVQIRDTYANWDQGKLRVSLGFQSIGWGETFGFYIADIVNPRDLTDPLLLELGWIRLPVFALNTQYFLDRATFQFIFTPVPRTPEFPAYDPYTGLGVAQLPAFDFARIAKDAEFGGKASYLFESGFDVSLLYYRHWNRNAAFTLQPPGYLQPVQTRVQTLGMTASQSIDAWVLRMDSVYHIGQPIQNPLLGNAATTNDWQTIVGTDVTVDEVLLGGQYQTDLAQGRFLNWVSARATKKFLSGKLEPELFYFRGIGNADQWLEPKLTWNATDALTASVRADLVWAGVGLNGGALPALRNEDRILTWLTYRW